MDPLTHALTSVALGRAGFNKLARMATPMLLVSGLAADVDWVTRMVGPSAFLRGHRTATHSFVGTFVIIVLVSAAFWFAGQKFPKMAVTIFPALVICTVGAGVHLLLDMLNGYGVKLLWPFRPAWYAWDIVATVDPCIIFFLLCGLLLPDLFRLILEEIGSKPKQRGLRGAIVGLVLVVLFVTGRGFAHQRAVALLDSREYRGQVPLTVAAFPKPLNPLIWSGVVETDNALFNVDVPIGPGFVFDPELADVHFKPEPSLTLNNAVTSAVGTEFLSYARFPLANVEPDGDGYEVRIRDMRFATELAGRRGMIGVINLNAQSLVVSEHLEFDGDSKR
ncbi:MAG: metal-dependent hydrolase [Candidatus Acidiferrales bacterium]|jgi:inner membrane protein